MTRILNLWAVLLMLSIAPIYSAGIDDLVTGEYESDSRVAKLYWNTTKERDFYATVSGHAGISIPNAHAQGWEQNVTLKQVEERFNEDAQKKLAIILLEKNYTGSDKPDESHTALVKLLLKVGFDRVFVTQAHSRLTIIEEIHKKEHSVRGNRRQRP